MFIGRTAIALYKIWIKKVSLFIYSIDGIKKLIQQKKLVPRCQFLQTQTNLRSSVRIDYSYRVAMLLKIYPYIQITIL